jgi:hypothetical protein
VWATHGHTTAKLSKWKLTVHQVSVYGLSLQLRELSSTSEHLDTAASYLTDYSVLAASIQSDLAWVDGVMQRLDVTTCNATAHRLSSGTCAAPA